MLIQSPNFADDEHGSEGLGGPLVAPAQVHLGAQVPGVPGQAGW